jgi:hypothetical protein
MYLASYVNSHGREGQGGGRLRNGYYEHAIITGNDIPRPDGLHLDQRAFGVSLEATFAAQELSHTLAALAVSIGEDDHVRAVTRPAILAGLIAGFEAARSRGDAQYGTAKPSAIKAVPRSFHCGRLRPHAV